MRFPAVASPRSNARAAALAASLAALLALSGCASRNELYREAVEETAPAESEAEAAQAKATADAGAQTTRVTKLQKFLWIFSPYRPDIQQGNFVSQEMLGMLKIGQTREQVQFVLGTPLLTDVFHADRWDYPFRLARGNGELTTSRVTVYFKDDKVVRIDGGNLPTEREYIERIAGPIRKPEKAAAKAEDPSSVSAQARESTKVE